MGCLILKGCIQVVLYRAGKARMFASLPRGTSSSSRRALIRLAGAAMEVSRASHVVLVKTMMVVILNREEGLVICALLLRVHRGLLLIMVVMALYATV